MTQSISIGQGVRLLVNNDPNRVIKFDPKDILFAEKFYHLVSEFKSKKGEYIKRAEAIDANTSLDDDGIPVNIQERLALLKDVCGYFRSQIDNVFGEGTSQAAFGDALSLDAFNQFFDGVSPYIASTRTEKINKYIPPVKKPVGKRRRA